MRNTTRTTNNSKSTKTINNITNQNRMNEFPKVMDPTIPHHSTSVEEEECSSSSSGSFSNNHHPRNNNGKRCPPNHAGYALSCGMVLPKRHRRRRSLSDDQFKILLMSYNGSNAVSHEPSSSKSSSDSLNHQHEGEPRNRLYRRRQSHRRPPTPFPSLLISNEPFQQYVKKIYSSQYDTNGPSRNINQYTDPLIHRMSQQKNIPPPPAQVHLHSNPTNHSSIPTSAPSATFVAHQHLDASYSSDIVLSNQILSMTDALEFSSKPHCLIEATAPHRVLHSNAALFASLLHKNHHVPSMAPTVPSSVGGIASSEVLPSGSEPIPAPIPATAPSSLSSSWDSVQSQINLLFGLCFASKSSTSSSQSTTSSQQRKGIVTLYPVYSTTCDFEQLMTGNNRNGSSDCSCESIPPRYYLIEVSNVENEIVQPSVSSTQLSKNEKHESLSMDGVPKLVIA